MTPVADAAGGRDPARRAKGRARASGAPAGGDAPPDGARSVSVGGGSAGIGDAGSQAPRTTDEAKADAERGPLRRCIATREVGPKEGMIRFVLAPAPGGGTPTLTPDLAGRLPGRGMWLSARGDVLERALTRGAFQKAARGPVLIPDGLRATIEDGLRRRLLDLVGFARRAGQAVTGFQQAREWLRTGRAAVLVEAMDGSPAERARLIGGGDATVVAALTAAELGGVFGRDHAVHVAVAPGRLAGAIVAEAARWRGIAMDRVGGTDRPHGGGGKDRAARRAAGTDGSPGGAATRLPGDDGMNGSPEGDGIARSSGGLENDASPRGDGINGSPQGDGVNGSPRGDDIMGPPPGGETNGPPHGGGRTGQVQGIG